MLLSVRDLVQRLGTDSPTSAATITNGGWSRGQAEPPVHRCADWALSPLQRPGSAPRGLNLSKDQHGRWPRM